MEKSKQKNKKPEFECWIWKKGTRNGYGVLSIDSKLFYVHRLSYALYKGRIPKNKCILHKCDNPLCFNPSHLFAGTRTDNAEDRDLKGRTAKGENHYKTTLTKSAVIRIRKLVSEKKNHQSIADEYNISRSSVTRIASRKTWKEI